MWNNFFPAANNAKELLASAGDVLTQYATSHVRNTKPELRQQNLSAREEESSSITDKGTAVEEDASSGWNNNKSSSGSTGISSYMKSLRLSKGVGYEEESDVNHRAQEVFDTLKLGWGSVLKAVETTQKVVEKEIASIQSSGLFQSSPSGSYRITDPTLPLDVLSLRDAEISYITSRIITLSHPFIQSSTNGDITPQRKLAAIGHFLDKRHLNRYMVWNLTELEYDTSVMNDQVMTFRFPGMPSPPLGMLIKIIMSMESWLKADSQNVLVVHCLTGRGRTCTVLTALLCWIGEAGFGVDSRTGRNTFGTVESDTGQSGVIQEALEYISQCKRCSVETLTIPSQRRYLYTYFANMLDGIRPSSTPLILKRVILSSAPKFDRRPVVEDLITQSSNVESDVSLGCSPYIQVFQGEQLLCTAASTSVSRMRKDELPFCSSVEGSISFSIDLIIKGDFLLRCRHLTMRGQRLSMFRAAINTGYIPPNKVLRLTKAQLDGACTDNRFDDSFFVDLIFDSCDDTSCAALSSHDTNMESSVDAAINNNPFASSTTVVNSYDSMVHTDSRFWDLIASRKNLRIMEQHTPIDPISIDANRPRAKMSGPTIGKRRDFKKERTVEAERGSVEELSSTSKAGVSNTGTVRKTNILDSFSIGTGFDFMDDDGDPLDPKQSPVITPLKQDDLMDALNAIEDDLDTHDAVNFDPCEYTGERDADPVHRSEKMSQIVEDGEPISSVVAHVKLNDVETHENEEYSLPEITSTVLKDVVQNSKNDFNFDDDDFAELEDLEQFLTKARSP